MAADQPKTDKKKKPPSTAILQCPKKEQVVEIAKALLREYMHKKGYVRTLKSYDNEDPRTEYTISSRKLMQDMMAIKGGVRGSIMEEISSRKIERRGVMSRVAELDKEIESLREEVKRLKKKIQKEKKPPKKEKKPKRASSAPPPALEEPAFLAAEIGVGYKSKGPIGFGGRDWAPPAVTSAPAHIGSETWAANKILTGAEFKDLREKMRNEVEEGRSQVEKMTHHHGGAAAGVGPGGTGLPTTSAKPDKMALRLTSPPAEVLSPTTSALRPSSDTSKRDKKVSFA